MIPEDVRSICKDVLRHRIGLTYEAEAENVNIEDVIEDVLLDDGLGHWVLQAAGLDAVHKEPELEGGQGG